MNLINISESEILRNKSEQRSPHEVSRFKATSNRQRRNIRRAQSF